MTRFLYITDTHFGAAPMGYQQQKGYPERLPELVGYLNDWIVADGGVDFVLHGGDLVDTCRPELIRQAADAFRPCVPLYLCLGNHDVNAPGAAPLWLKEAPALFGGSQPHYEIEGEATIVHVVPTHWDDEDYYWGNRQDPRLSEAQLARIESTLQRHPNRTHVLCTHAPVLGVGTAQTGLEEVSHDPPPAFRTTVTDLMDRFPQLRGVLCGHNHVNAMARHGGAVVASGASFSEVPFEFKLVQVSAATLSIRTLVLLPEVGFEARYDFDRCFVQGRDCDRNAELEW